MGKKRSKLQAADHGGGDESRGSAIQQKKVRKALSVVCFSEKKKMRVKTHRKHSKKTT